MQPMTVVHVWHSEGLKNQYLILPLVENINPSKGRAVNEFLLQARYKKICLPGENEVLERLANLFVSGDFGRVSCERGATCNIAQPSKSLEEK